MKIVYWTILSILLFSSLWSACSPREKAATGVLPLPATAGDQVKVQSPVDRGWQVEWEKTIQAARKEGSLSIYTSMGVNGRKAITEGFEKKFGIKVEYTPGRGSDLAEKILREYRAGLHMADIYHTGTPNMLSDLKPAKVLEPLEPLLILPEILDTKAYWDGKLPWRDKDKLTMAILAYPAPSLFTNTNLVKPEELVSYKDLLNPKWKGKIVMLDPIRPGSGEKWVHVMGSQIMDWDFIRELLKQDMMIHVDQPIMAHWLTQGKYAISIGVASEHVLPLIEAGAPLRMVRPKEGAYLTGGSFVFSVIKSSSHPNATKLFANWVLSKEGQTAYAAHVRQHGVRLDVPTQLLLPEFVRDPGQQYTITDDDIYEVTRMNNREMVKKMFEPYWK